MHGNKEKANRVHTPVTEEEKKNAMDLEDYIHCETTLETTLEEEQKYEKLTS